MAPRIHPVWLDYGAAGADRKLLENLSAICWTEQLLWTASDEGRTLECLEPHGSGFRICRQVALDGLFDDLPGRRSEDEIDIESIDVVKGRIWICGSHSIVRRQIRKTDATTVDPRFRVRKSRRLLGNVATSVCLSGNKDGEPGVTLPFSGKNGLRRRLAINPYLRPFIDLPSKENGLDIEGVAVNGRRLLLGLRGPIVDSIAIVVELRLGSQAQIEYRAPSLHFLNLGGLGVRDLAMRDGTVLVLAGPVNAAPGPFRIYEWQRRTTNRIQVPELRYEWLMEGDAPEGLCRKDHGLLIVYDLKKNTSRIRGHRVRVDFLTGV